MLWDNKIVWGEGMFLQPQHFQQFDRYVERLVRGVVTNLRPYPWGVIDLQINRELMTTGKFAVTACQGVMPDGTPFSIPGDVDHPPPLELNETTRNVVVYLALPVRHPGAVEVAVNGAESGARYVAAEFEATDTNADSASVALLSVGKLRLRYMLENEDRAGFVTLGLARILEVRADRNVVLDDAYIPPCLRCSAATVLSNFIAELQGLTHHRGEALAARLAAGAKGSSDIADAQLLQAINRHEPYLAHEATTPDLHPETFYSHAVQMAGELATFTSRSRRPPRFPAYRHDDLQATFAPVIQELRRSLSAVLEQSAIPIRLEERRFGVRVGVVADKSLFATAAFVLAVKAAMPPEVLRQRLPNQATIGPVEQIRDLVGAKVRGVPLTPLPVAPRQMPFYPGTSYFDLDRSGRTWQQLASSGGIAVYISGEFPQIEMELWAIRG
jgi:type VI secretion system protein ImpJ